jgi:superfamily II DNA or RNA helicase
MKTTKTHLAKRKGKSKKVKVSQLRKPSDMTLSEWQVALRREFGIKQQFGLKNIGDHPVFSEFMVTNPKTGGQYRVAIRGKGLGDNYCSCPDFSVNTLGTCKHIEFALSKLENKRGAKKAFAEGFEQVYSEVYLRYGARRQVVFSPGVDCPAGLLRLSAEYFDDTGILTPDGCCRFHVFMKKAASFDHDLRIYNDALSFIAQIRERRQLEKRLAESFPKGIHSGVFTKLLKGSLYPYQRQGAFFAARAGRSLLADDMGLGKTIQAMAAVEILARTMGVERVLVICPTSLKYQWKEEIERFTTRSVEVIEGLLPKRTEKYTSSSFYKITNYDVIHRDKDIINRWGPEMIILDEAQRIKNWKTRAAQSIKKLDSRYAVVLTGTPLENRLEELHSIVEFVDRFRLGPLFGFLDEHQHVDETGRVVGYRNLSKIGKTLAPILLRRTKTEVLKELPGRIEKNYLVPMTKEQEKYHNENQETVARIVAKWRRLGFLPETDQRILMIALQNMRMSCNSTYLLDRKTDFGVKADECIQVLGEIFEEQRSKVVVFSQWVRTHELLCERLDSARHDYVLFHGSVPSSKRKDLIKRFRTDEACRVFLSTDAGGVGLNLQNASAVINMDLPWNPAVLEQRIGRVHRLGQTGPVRVVNFIAQGTIEHGMLSLLSFKQSLFSGVLDNGDNEIFLGGTRLKRFMESVEKAAAAIPEPMSCETEDSREDAQIPSAVDESTQVAEEQVRQQRWTELISAGVSFIEKLGKAIIDESSHEGRIQDNKSDLRIEADPVTGRSYLRLPVPQKETLKEIAELFGKLTERL